MGRIMVMVLLVSIFMSSVAFAKPLKKKLQNPCVSGTWKMKEEVTSLVCFEDKKWHSPLGSFVHIYASEVEHNTVLTRQGIFVSCGSKSPTPENAIGRVELKSMQYVIDVINFHPNDAYWFLCK